MVRLFVGMLLAALATGACAADKVGAVIAIKGNCLVEADKQATPLKVGDDVMMGETIVTTDSAKLKMQMIDGSVIALGPNGRLTIQTYATDASGKRDVGLSLAAGLLRSVVAPATQPSRFEVTTATGVAAVRSTDWFIESKADVSIVGVLDGKVALTSRATLQQVDIPARWGARVIGEHDPVKPRLWTAEEFADVIARTDLD